MSQAGQANADALAAPTKLAGSANESSSAVTQTGKIGEGAMQAANVSAQLEEKIDSRNAKVGDQVVAKTTSKAQLDQGTQLLKGTLLVGKLTEVQANSSAQHTGHLAFTFDHAVLKDGREISIHATLQSISAPATVSAMGGGSDDFATAGGPVMASGARAGGGLLGGGGGAVAQTGSVTGGLVSTTSSTVANAANRVTSASEGTLHQTEGTLHHASGLVKQTAGSKAAAVAVYNLPGISASSSASGSSVLDASGKNVELSGGTQMVFSASKN